MGNCFGKDKPLLDENGKIIEPPKIDLKSINYIAFKGGEGKGIAYLGPLEGLRRAKSFTTESSNPIYIAESGTRTRNYRNQWNFSWSHYRIPGFIRFKFGMKVGSKNPN